MFILIQRRSVRDSALSCLLLRLADCPGVQVKMLVPELTLGTKPACACGIVRASCHLQAHLVQLSQLKEGGNKAERG